MWIVVLFLIAVLLYYWPLTLAGLALWALVTYIRWAAADPRPKYPRQSVQTGRVAQPVRTGRVAQPVRTGPVAQSVRTRPVTKPVQTGPVAQPKRVAKPRPVRELPAPDYLPRWNASRRLDVNRELAEWQKAFDSAA